jgi:hypothetical protein
MTATATLSQATRPGPVASEMEKHEMDTTTTREVGALYVEGFGPMNATEAKEALESVARLNAENRELLNERAQVRAELDNARELWEIDENRLKDRITETENALTEARTENQRLRFANIDADDPRLADLWEKAYRYASHAGFCSEFERIADALGIPQQSLVWSGTAYVDVTLTVPVPVSGMATRHEINEGAVEPHDIDRHEIAEALNDRDWSAYDVDVWSVDTVEDVTADDE